LKALVRIAFVVWSVEGVFPGNAECATASAAARADAQMKNARLAHRQGNYGEAVETFDSTLTQPRDSVSQAVRARALLGKGRTYEVWSGSGAGHEALADSAEIYYRLVIKGGDRDAKAVAGVRLGELQLQQGDAKAATKTLREADPSNLTPGQQALRDIALARSQLAGGDTSAAVESAVRAMKSGAADDLVVDQAFDLVLGFRGSNGEVAAQLGRALLDAGRPVAVLQRLGPCIERWPDARSGVDMLGLMLRAQARLGADSTSVNLVLARFDGFPDLQPALSEARFAFGGDWPVPMGQNDVRGFFPTWWGPRDRMAAISEFLLASANARLGGSAYRKSPTAPESLAALARCVAAVRIDRSNADAALVACNLLATSHLLNPNAADGLINELVSMLFEQKRSAYDAEDYPTIVHMHYVLARIFEQRGAILGSRSDPRSVVGQLTRGIEAQAQGERMGIAMPPIPLMYEWLGRIDAQTDSTRFRDQVSHLYLMAARDFARAGSLEDAKASVSRAGPPSSEDAALFAEVQSLIRAMPATAD
jgi:tetratricopeptide (TPR) repeat protein